MLIVLLNFMFISGMLVFFFNYKYFLINLLSIEFIMLSLFSLVYLVLLMKAYELFFSMIFISFMVCEGVLGLSLLISMVRSLGNSLFFSVNLMRW